MSTCDIQAHIEELYGIGVSTALVSAVTEAVLKEVSSRQNRPLEPVHAIVCLDALRVKIRDEGLVRNKAVYLAIGIACKSYKEVAGLSIEQTKELMNIHVGNVPYSLTESELRDAFAEFGHVSAVTILTDRETGRSRGFGFVDMPNQAEATAAIAFLNGKDLGGRALRVSEARPRERR